jgi:arylsulfatase A-like enzyme
LKNTLNRRDFLKLASLLSLNMAIPRLRFRPGIAEPGTGKNVLVVVFDAFSAKHISFYGYGRQTMPNLTRLIEKGTVYHQHYANGPFTTPGTASLLTSTLPWTHRALDHNDPVADWMTEKSIFHAFRGHHAMAYSHNLLVDTFLKQFLPAIEDYIPRDRLYLNINPLLEAFRNDDDIANLAWTRSFSRAKDGYSYSLLGTGLYELAMKGRFDLYTNEFPRGLPQIYDDSYYILEDGINKLQNLTLSAPQPFLGYFHFLPPHFPYNTRKEFVDQFAHDGFKPVPKPDHIFAAKRAEEGLEENRRYYDEYILYVDSEFARLYQFLEQNGILENTWLVFTSDHGEMFERGLTGHQMPPMFEPLVRVPLVIFAPGQDTRIDVYDQTNAIDLLPTLMHVTNQEIPDWAEGQIMPPFTTSTSADDRPIICLRGWGIEEDKPIHKGSVMLIRGNYKLVYIFGFLTDLPGGELVELYDLEADPEELNNLSTSHPEVVAEMLAELKPQLARTR